MAIKLIDEYPGQATPADANFPQSSFKEETAPLTFDGTPFALAMANDIIGPLQALLKVAGITPSGTADNASSKTSSQYLQGILHMIMSGGVFVDTGAADAYVLGVVGLNIAPPAYHDNMTLEFIPTNTNTGASTANVEAIDIKNIFLNGAALVAGDLLAGRLYTIRFSVANDRFDIVQDIGRIVQVQESRDGALQSGPTPIPYDDSPPQITEGDQVYSVAITPKKSTNILKITVNINATTSNQGAAGRIVAAVFKDAGVNAIAVCNTENSTVDGIVNMGLEFELVAGSVAAQTFTVRLGHNTAGTTYLNGDSTGRKFGGVLISGITIEEREVN